MTKWIAAMLAACSVACTSQVNAQATKLMLFGSEDHKTYLGCLNCSEYATDSVHNEYGDHGSQYATDSIFNRYGQYGSPYSNDSPCNQYANDPPVIVDGNGAFYGRLTLNAYHPQANKNEKLQGWLAGLCER
ncbi:hypothetical protein [Paraburkholderia caledonica]|uniref:Uncharacterized protein n=1 Tax=Paraburkholderia caledonica TaxID=134536 RepID=A0AB73I7Z9_9BURK|nr:hypothetical protein [Paraburkholderia caledonica]